MKSAFALVFALTLTAAGAAAMAEQEAYPQTEEALQAEFDKLNWQFESVTYRLVGSHSSLTLPQGYMLLTGGDAQRFMYLLNGTEFPEVEALALDPNTNELVWFSYVESGYVTDDDWSELDADALLEQVKEATEAANEERRKNGISALHVVGWVERPRFDAEARIAYWTIQANDEAAGELRNAKAVRLSRHGYHEVVWAGDSASYSNAAATLGDMLKAHTYDPGFRYADFATGDKLAGFGIASLVAVTAGGEKAKGLLAGLVAVALLLLKKGWFVVVAVLAGGWAAVKRFFGRRPVAAPLAPERTDGPDSGGAG